MPLKRSPLVVALSAFFLSSVSTLRAGELEDYVAKEDNALSLEASGEMTILGVRAINYRLTSQKWRGLKWQHWLTVLIPAKVDPHQKGILIIEGGSSTSKAPNARSGEAMMLASTVNQLRAPIALLGQVPNQPLFGDLKEDNLIAHTFQQYLDSGENDWPLLLPMTKSAVRAMDALQALAKEGKLATTAGAALEWEQFIVTGASKRGWTTWLTAAVDKRVCAIAPMVIDVLDMPAQMELQLKSYGKFSDMIKPYTERGIQKRMDTPEGRKLNAIVDPISYRELYTMPKLVVLGTNDPYWSSDSASVYFDRIPGPKSLYYMPNAGHGLGLEALGTLNAFFAAQLDGMQFPELSSQRDGASLTVSWRGRATAAEHWSATALGRDFREQTWTAKPLEIAPLEPVGAESPSGGKATESFDAPKEGWSAHFLRVTYPPLREGMSPFYLALPITVLPETFPHPMPEQKKN